MITKETIFTHKEHYLAFRAAWAESINSKEFEITGAYHMLYNILRGKAFDHGFTPITRTTKLQNGAYINLGAYNAARDLYVMLNDIDNCRSYAYGRLQKMLSVFQGTVTDDMFKMVAEDLPDRFPMTSDYGPYMKVAEFIIDMRFEDKPTTFAEIQAILEITQQKEAA